MEAVARLPRQLINGAPTWDGGNGGTRVDETCRACCYGEKKRTEGAIGEVRREESGAINNGG